MITFESTKIIELGSCAFRQWRAEGTHCKYVHGYRLMAKFWFGCTGLDDKNWVINFGGLKHVKELLQDQFDHTLCIAKDDPLLEHFKELDRIGGCQLRIMDGVGIEKTAEWCFNTVNPIINEMSVGRCWLNKVEVWEHDLNSAIYEKRS
jgi:6-pyruvoyltetrahydropterin/6-carboxytetrahydropterin synthase